MILTLAFASACNARSAGESGGKAGPSVSEKKEAAVIVPRFSSDSAYRFLSDQLSFGPRNPGSAGNARCAEYLAGTIARLGADTVITHTPAIEVPYADGKVKITNILGRFNPSNPRRILLVAHWDTRPVADEDSDPKLREKPIPGANDGGSGTAVLLEVARVLAQNPRSEIGVDILFVDAEDSGIPSENDSWCLGTQEWLKKYPSGVPGPYVPEFGILLDMVGGRNARFHREMFSDSFAPQIVDKVWSAAAAEGFSGVFVNSRGNAITDDHIPFNKAGIPTINIIESKSVSTGSFPPVWHTHADNLDNISKESLRAAGQTVLRLIYNRK